MFSKKIEIKNHLFKMTEKNNSLQIKLIGDIHYSKTFKEEKFNIILDELKKTPTDYLFIAGDLIDKVKFLQNYKKDCQPLLKWLEQLSRTQKTFISIGNHDFRNFNRSKDNTYHFWKKVSSIKGIQVSHFSPYYEDDKIIVFMIGMEHFYLRGKQGYESKEMLIEYLKENKKCLASLPKDKVKILMVHSPILMSDPDILDLVKEYDFIFSGHMHNGVVPPIIDSLIKNNRGLVAPNKSLFPDNARGVKEMYVNDKPIRLIVTGGITKLAESSGFLSKFNDIVYPISIDDITINSD